MTSDGAVVAEKHSDSGTSTSGAIVWLTRNGQTLSQINGDDEIGDFTPFRYDDRQYCSHVFSLSEGSLTRTPNGCFPQFHPSVDDLQFVRPDALAGSYSRCMKVIGVLEGDMTYVNLNVQCEPQPGGRRGIYDGVVI